MEPLNFSWVIPNCLAGCAGPKDKGDLLFLKQKGITMLVRLIEEDGAGVVSQQIATAGLLDLYVPIKDFDAPSQDQIDKVTGQVNRCISEGGKVAVSCMMGIGRTGTMLSCVLVSRGYTVKEAFEKVKKERKQNEAFETPSQRKAVFAFARRTGRSLV